MSGDIKRLGDRRGANGFKPGVSGNPGGKVSLANDLKRAAMIGVPAEVLSVLEEWREDADTRLAELGALAFLAGLSQALDDACKRVLPVDAAEARAMWWRTILPIAFAGPCGPKDSNWTYASQEVGVRLLGKPKETIAIEGSDSTPIDWSKVPEERREYLLAAIAELQSYITTEA